MTCVKENKIDIIPISEVAGKTKLVDTDSDIIRQAKFAGLSFGDEPCGIYLKSVNMITDGRRR